MNQREERQKAQEVFNECNFVLGRKTTFENEFPQVEECVVEVEESGHGVSDRTRIGTYRNLNTISLVTDVVSKMPY